MSIQKLLEIYDFHDSIIESMQHVGRDLILNIELCQWRQMWYKYNDDEIIPITLRLSDINNYVWDSYKTEQDINCDSILKFDCNENKVEIVLYDEVISVITFECNEVEFIN